MMYKHKANDKKLAYNSYRNQCIFHISCKTFDVTFNWRYNHIGVAVIDGNASSSMKFINADVIDTF